MAAPFCNACGATIAGGTRFCVKCGQPAGQAAPPPPPPPPSDPAATLLMTTPIPPQAAPFSPPPDPAPYYPAAEPAKSGSGAGILLGLLGLLLLAAGGAVYLYTTHGPGFQAASTQVAAAPAQPAAPVAAPAPSPAPEVIPPNPDYAKPEVIPPNPDFAKKDAARAPSSPPGQPKPKPAVKTVGDPGPAVAPPQPVRTATAPTSGTLHASVEVGLNGEVVFENLPNGRLRFIYDHSAWRPTISHQANGTQTLVMRSLKPGIQRVCDVQWEIVQ
jgi:hypothetical protein